MPRTQPTVQTRANLEASDGVQEAGVEVAVAGAEEAKH